MSLTGPSPTRDYLEEHFFGLMEFGAHWAATRLVGAVRYYYETTPNLDPSYLPAPSAEGLKEMYETMKANFLAEGIANTLQLDDDHPVYGNFEICPNARLQEILLSFSERKDVPPSIFFSIEARGSYASGPSVRYVERNFGGRDLQLVNERFWRGYEKWRVLQEPQRPLKDAPAGVRPLFPENR